jgi:translation initiation factor IF-3
LEILNRVSARKLNQVRMVGEGVNEVISIMDAMKRAEEVGLDLVLVSTDAKPPVVRIQDFKKIEYEKKKAKKANKASSTLKEIQFKINISEHDLSTKISKIDTFLKRGDKVKISVRLKGRERENPERAHNLLARVEKAVECKVTKMGGPIAMAILEPVKQTTKPVKPSA